jgi:hypothetical protein
VARQRGSRASWIATTAASSSSRLSASCNASAVSPGKGWPSESRASRSRSACAANGCRATLAAMDWDEPQSVQKSIATARSHCGAPADMALWGHLACRGKRISWAIGLIRMTSPLATRTHGAAACVSTQTPCVSLAKLPRCLDEGKLDRSLGIMCCDGGGSMCSSRLCILLITTPFDHTR